MVEGILLTKGQRVKKRSNCRKKERLAKIWVSASLTVEAAFIVPIILFTIVGGINISYDMFKQARMTSEIQEEIEELDPVEIVRRNTLLREKKNKNRT